MECAERGLDPMTTNLVVADESRTSKTICLAVSPSLKAWGIPGRPRLFEVIRKVEEVNRRRLERAPGHRFSGASWSDAELRTSPWLKVDYHCGGSAHGPLYEAQLGDLQDFLKYVAPEDIHVYSIDEVFIDATSYLKAGGLTAEQLASRMIRDVFQTTGITATAGIGPNLSSVQGGHGY